jgi:Arc/MetJ-type ribon-helix-helix transcriptional regulator
MHVMQVTVRLGELSDEFVDHLDAVEEETGYRPNKSEVVRDALSQKLGSNDDPANESSGCDPEDAGVSA